MKHLLLLRHAKSDWNNARLTDFDRPLATRGCRDAPRIGQTIRERGIVPDKVLCSPAVRARDTACAVLLAAQLQLDPQYIDTIYCACADDLFDAVRAYGGDCECLMIVGHNPSLEDFAARLTGTFACMRTCSIACIDIHRKHWKDVDDAAGHLAWVVSPKQLADNCERTSD